MTTQKYENAIQDWFNFLLVQNLHLRCVHLIQHSDYSMWWNITPFIVFIAMSFWPSVFPLFIIPGMTHTSTSAHLLPLKMSTIGAYIQIFRYSVSLNVDLLT